MLQSDKNLLTDKAELMNMRVEELRKICKDLGISYYENRKRLAKGPMADRIVSVVRKKVSMEEEEIINRIEEQAAITKDKEVDVKRAEKKAEIRKKYIEQAKVGEIVAFRFPSGKVISAMIKRKSTNRRKFMVETSYGKEYKISFDDVVWVKTNKRWPKGIYILFNNDNNVKMEVTKDDEEIS